MVGGEAEECGELREVECAFESIAFNPEVSDFRAVELEVFQLVVAGIEFFQHCQFGEVKGSELVAGAPEGLEEGLAAQGKGCELIVVAVEHDEVFESCQSQFLNGIVVDVELRNGAVCGDGE